MSRRSVKDALKTLLSTVPGVAHVFRGMPKRIPAQMMPAIVIFTPKDDEDRITSMAGRGRRKVTYNTSLFVIYIDPLADAELGSLAFDDLVDAIKAKIRENPLIIEGSDYPIASLKYLRSKVEQAKEAGKDDGAVTRIATVEFDVVDFVEG